MDAMCAIDPLGIAPMFDEAIEIVSQILFEVVPGSSPGVGSLDFQGFLRGTAVCESAAGHAEGLPRACEQCLRDRPDRFTDRDAPASLAGLIERLRVAQREGSRGARRRLRRRRSRRRRGRRPRT